MSSELDELVAMTRALGLPERNYVVVGEGNTSFRIDGDSFWIKASGQQMEGIHSSGFVAMHFEPILAMLDKPPGDLTAQQAIMEAAKVDANVSVLPSVEVTFHAMLLVECGVNCIAHTHPVAVNQIMCSTRAHEFASNRLFPDEAVLCGPHSVFVPYVDPGLALALAIREQVHDYLTVYKEAPKVILLANHGLIALGQTTTEAFNITAMCAKAAEIFVGACVLGKPVFMTEAEIMHIVRRPDEIYRRQRFVDSK